MFTVSTSVQRKAVHLSTQRSFSLVKILGLVSLFAKARGTIPEPFPAEFRLSNLNGTNGFLINGQYGGEQLGLSVSCAGDINSDGIDDLLLGSDSSQVGRAYVIFGHADLGKGATIDVSGLSGVDGFEFIKSLAQDLSGLSVSGGGDVNGDGIDDLLLEARLADPPGRGNAGKTYVVFGAPNIGVGGRFVLSSLNGTNGFVIFGEKTADESGVAGDIAGDINADGISDLLIGARYADTAADLDVGKAYIVFGAVGIGGNGIVDLSALNGTNGFVIFGEPGAQVFGRSVSGVGDVNADGIVDVLIGAPLADPTASRRDAGRSYVLFGGADLGRGGDVQVSNLDATTGVVLNGELADDGSGVYVSGAGDMNGDGVDDFVIGATGADAVSKPNVGKTYVVFGQENLGSSGAIELSSLNGTNGIAFIGEKSGDQSGSSVAGVGDINGDRLSDILIGAAWADPPTGRDAGTAYVVFGRNAFDASPLELAKLNGSDGFACYGERASDIAGGWVSGAGDVNADGIADLLVGAWRADGPGGANAGRAYVIFGRNLAPPTTSSTMASTASTTTISSSVGITPTQHSSRLSTQRVSEVSSASVAITTRKTPAENPGGIDTTGLVFGLLGGLCALVSAMGGAVFWRKRQQKRELSMEAHMEVVGDADNGHIYASIQPREPHYSNLTSQPETHDHYIGIDVVNRQHDEYESARMQRMQQHYDDIPKH